MTEQELQTALHEIIDAMLECRKGSGGEPSEEMDDLADALDGVESVTNFYEAGVLTHNKGLVIELEDGGEFQINILRSR
ncbi:MAG: hypothetical protein Q9O74_12175 [Planctomycetota bacterium]|nr:hypothetical protein [Planctomycetota bacterium]